MIAFPNCKINLGLNILRKRDDGFHDLETIFYPIRLCDAVEILPSSAQTQITITGLPVDDANNNLCLRAFNLIKKDYSQLPEIHIHLHKAIPIGAGLGGGSSNAAFVIQLLNKEFRLDIPEQKRFFYASQLGSDCSFFLLNKTSLATGRGEVLEQLNIILEGYKILLVNPGIHISTAEAFKNIQPAVPPKKIRQIIQQPIDTWKDELINDFEKYAFEKYAAIKEIKENLYNDGAVYAAMSGSGSTIFGLYKKDAIINFNPDQHYFCRMINTA